MDNNFSKILETFKSLNETFNRDNIVIDGKQVNLNTIQIDGIDTNDYPDFVDAYIGNASFVDGTPLSDDQCLALSQNYPQIVSDNIQDQLIDAGDAMHDAYKHGEIGEGSMAEQHSSGPKFTGYWKGTDAGTPGKHMVGSSESVEQESEEAQPTLAAKLKARWEKTKREKGLAEAGANNPAQDTAGTAAANPAQDAQKIAQTQKGINLMKSAGVQVPSVQQAVTSTLKDPLKDPADIQDKKVASAFGQATQNIIKSGDPSLQNQLAALIKKAGAGAQ